MFVSIKYKLSILYSLINLSLCDQIMISLRAFWKAADKRSRFRPVVYILNYNYKSCDQSGCMSVLILIFVDHGIARPTQYLPHWLESHGETHRFQQIFCWYMNCLWMSQCQEEVSCLIHNRKWLPLYLISALRSPIPVSPHFIDRPNIVQLHLFSKIHLNQN